MAAAKVLDVVDPFLLFDLPADEAPTDRPPLRKQQFKSISERQREIIRRKCLGEKDVNIAADLCITPMCVHQVTNSELGRAEIERLSQLNDIETSDLMVEIQNIAPRAVDLHRQVIDGTGEGENASIALRAKVAGEMLDRAGYARQTKVHVDQHYLGEVSINLIKERAKALGIVQRDVIDVGKREVCDA